MSLIKKYFSFSVGVWINAILTLFWTAFISRYLVPEDLGKITMYLSLFSGLSAITMMGSSDAIMRFYKKYERKNYLIWVCSLPSIAFGILLVLLSFLLKEPLNFLISGESQGVFSFILSLEVFLSVIISSSMSLLRAQGKGLTYSIFNVMNNSLYVIFTIVYLLAFSKDFTWVIISHFVGTLITAILSYTYLNEYWRFTKVEIEDLKETFYYSFPLLFGSLLWWLTNWTDRFMLRGLSDFNQIGLYSVGSKLVSIVNLITSAFATLWYPYAYSIFENNEAKDIFKKTANTVALLTFIVALTLNISKRVIFDMLFSANYIEGINVVPFLLLPIVLTTILVVVGRGINFSKKTHLAIYTNSSSIISNVILNFFLIPKFGATGAAIGTALSFIVFFTVEYILSVRLYKVDYEIWKVYLLSTIFLITGLFEFFSLKNISYILNLFLLIITLTVYWKEFKALSVKYLRFFKSQ